VRSRTWLSRLCLAPGLIATVGARFMPH